MEYAKYIVTDKEEIRDIINISFIGDDDLFNTYHLINNDIESAIEDTFFKIKEIIDVYGGCFYKICRFNKNIGYVNIIPDMHVLHSFGLTKNERNESSKEYLMSIIDELFGAGIYCNMFSKNKRAIEFLKKNGYIDQQVTMLFKK